MAKDQTKAFIKTMGKKIFNVIQKKKRLYFEVKNEDLLEVASYLFKTMECRLSTATAMETYHAVEVLYQFSHDPTGCYFCPRVVMTNKKKPVMNSISPVVRGAGWIEREMFEFWGITFEGHPRKEPLLSRNHPKGLKQPLRFGRRP